MDLSRIRWPLVALLAAVAMTRPVLSITGLADDWGRPATPLLATAAITVVWIGAVVLTRQPRPVATLVATGLGYAVLATVTSGVLSPILDGELRGPLANPFALVGVLVVNAGWGALSGLVADLLLRRRR